MSFPIMPYVVPKTFSLIYNFDDSMVIFDNLITNAKKQRIKHVIDMKKTEVITMEVLLYLISLKNIWKKKKIKFKIQILAPEDQNLAVLLETSGLNKYFKGSANSNLIEENIYPMCDGGQDTINPEAIISQNDRCVEIRNFAYNMLKTDSKTDNKKLNLKLLTLLNAIAEMIRNTEDHAYEKKTDQFQPLRNWYFFAAKVSDGISFYFLDNGKGIINTVTPKLRDKSIFSIDNNAEINLFKDVLDGNFRSQTDLPYRGKGLPEINGFFNKEDIITSTIITNNITYQNEETNLKFDKKKKFFNGTLYMWIVK